MLKRYLSFAQDSHQICLETLEEINGEAREIFLEAGGEEFEYIYCLNDDNEHIEVLMDIVSPYLSVN